MPVLWVLGAGCSNGQVAVGRPPKSTQSNMTTPSANPSPSIPETYRRVHEQFDDEDKCIICRIAVQRKTSSSAPFNRPNDPSAG